MTKLGQKALLFVYDRGYPSDRFIDQHIKLGVDFLFRLPRDKVLLPSGELELLLTTLIGKDYTIEDLSRVYHGRWSSMEEGYKKQKITMQLENFAGKTVTAID